MSTTNNGGLNGFETITINTGGLMLNTGQVYVAFLSALGLFDSATGIGSMAAISSFPNDAYSGGRFVYLNNDNDPSVWTTARWNALPGSNWDLSFRMGFSEVVSEVVPAPATLALFGLGLAGLGFARRRKAAT